MSELKRQEQILEGKEAQFANVAKERREWHGSAGVFAQIDCAYWRLKAEVEQLRAKVAKMSLQQIQKNKEQERIQARKDRAYDAKSRRLHA